MAFQNGIEDEVKDWKMMYQRMASPSAAAKPEREDRKRGVEVNVNVSMSVVPQTCKVGWSGHPVLAYRCMVEKAAISGPLLDGPIVYRL